MSGYDPHREIVREAIDEMIGITLQAITKMG
jgi:hypothetical protein